MLNTPIPSDTEWYTDWQNKGNKMEEIIHALKTIAWTTKAIFPKSVDYLDEKLKEQLMKLFSEGKASPQMVIPILETLPFVSNETLRRMFLNLLQN